jgi:hypothetical protein
MKRVGSTPPPAPVPWTDHLASRYSVRVVVPLSRLATQTLRDRRRRAHGRSGNARAQCVGGVILGCAALLHTHPSGRRGRYRRCVVALSLTDQPLTECRRAVGDVGGAAVGDDPAHSSRLAMGIACDGAEAMLTRHDLQPAIRSTDSPPSLHTHHRLPLVLGGTSGTSGTSGTTTI